jgi:cytosine deaminase
MTTTLLRQATIVHTPVTGGPTVHAVVDVTVADGTIAGVGAPTPDPVEHNVGREVDRAIELDGQLLLPAAVEPHAHLDKAFMAERAENVTGDLQGAIDAMAAIADQITQADIEQRAERAARLMAANGYTAVRTHVDLTEYTGLTNMLALVEVRRRLADLIDIEIVALTGRPVTGPAGAEHRALLVDALAAGADLVGGCPHLEPDGAIEASTDVLLEMAADAGVGIDLHTDETLDPTVLGLEYLADRVLAGFEQPVTASHCVSLGQQSLVEQERVAAKIAAAGIGVVTLPHTNLWLGGRDRQPVPRGLTAVDALRRAGVAVAAGADNLQDPFNPMGRACPFETAALMVLVAHDLPTTAWRSVSADVRRVLGRAGGSIEPGQPADLIAVPAATLRQAIAEGPLPRRVFRAGIELPQR